MNNLSIKTRIKKVQNNQYLKTENYNYWIRNYSNSSNYLDINNLTPESDYFLLLKNEFFNNRKKYSWIDSENLYYDKAIIVSDGYDFNKIFEYLDKISVKDNICIMSVNGSLRKWQAYRSPTYYVVNNPYDECVSFLPKNNRSLPRCIASNRTNYLFLENYNGLKYRYAPVSESKLCFSNQNSENFYQIDDYRNPICAAIGLCYRFHVSKILFLCCDDVFDTQKPGSISLEENLYYYSTQDIAVEIIDAYAYWTKNRISFKHYCRWKKTNNIEYINIDEVLGFIKDEL